MMLSKGQREVLEILRKTAGVALDKSRYGNLPVQLRTHTLVCGPSGVGKSHLCRELGKQLGVGVLILNCSSWQLLGSQSSKYTWDVIVKFLDENEKGIIVLDEIDKVGGQSDWQGHLRLEIHDLLDGVIPMSVDVPYDAGSEGWLWGDTEPSKDESKPKKTEEGKRKLLTHRLKCSFLIVGAGAWQHLWDNQEKPSLGFVSIVSGKDKVPSQQDLQSSIYPEVLKRFRSEILVIPPMTREDYRAVSRSISNTFDPLLRARFQGLVEAKIDKALQDNTGMRFFEGVLLDTFVDTPSQQSISPEPENDAKERQSTHIGRGSESAGSPDFL